MNNEFEGRIVISAEALAKAFPNQTRPGVIKQADFDGQQLKLVFVTGAAMPALCFIPWTDIERLLPSGLPAPRVAVAVPTRNSICLGFAGSEETDLLKPRDKLNDPFEIGQLSTTGFHSMPYEPGA